MTVTDNTAAALREVRRSAAMRDILAVAGGQVAEAAADLAPVLTGAGAASIHYELVTVNGVPEVHVSWDRAHYYLGFHELGTEDMPAHPFLRPAAASFR